MPLESIKTLKDHRGQILAVAFSPDGRYALTGGGDRTVMLWDIKTGENIRTLKGHKIGGINAIAFSPDGRYALTGGYDRTARLWDIKTGENIRTMTGHTNSVKSVAFSPDGTYALTGGDYTARLWEIINTPENHFVFILCKPIDVQQSNLEETKAVELINKASTLIKMNLFSEAYNVLRQIQTYRGFECAPEILDLLSFCGKNGKRVKLKDAWQEKVISVHNDSRMIDLVAVAFSPDGRYALTGDDRGNARLWDLKTGENIKTLTLKRYVVNSIAFSPDCRYMLTGRNELNALELNALLGSGDHSARIWDMATGKNIRTLTGPAKISGPFAFSPDGRYVLTGSRSNAALLWDVPTGENINILAGHTCHTGVTGWISAVAFSPDGRYALTGGGDRTARLWDLKTGKNIKTLIGHASSVSSVAFSPDGRYALIGSSYISDYLTGGSDRTAWLWDITTGENIKTLTLKGHHVNSVAFSPDGKYALTGGLDKTVRLWDITTGENIKTLTGHLGHVFSVAFSPDCRYALTGSSDNTVRLWEFDWELEFPDDKNAKLPEEEREKRG